MRWSSNGCRYGSVTIATNPWPSLGISRVNPTTNNGAFFFYFFFFSFFFLSKVIVFLKIINALFYCIVIKKDMVYEGCITTILSGLTHLLKNFLFCKTKTWREKKSYFRRNPEDLKIENSWFYFNIFYINIPRGIDP